MSTARDHVGPVLSHGDTTSVLITAMRRTNAGLEVQDCGAYLRVSAQGRCIMRREAVERLLGRPFVLPGDLEAVMPSFVGRLHMDEEQAVWEFRGAS